MVFSTMSSVLFLSLIHILRSEDYNQWYEDLQAKYPAELTEDGKAIPTL